LYKADHGTVIILFLCGLSLLLRTYLYEPFFTFSYWFTSTSSKDMEHYMKTGYETEETGNT